MSTLKDKLTELLKDESICKYMFNGDLLTILEEETRKYVIEMYGFLYKQIHQQGGENKGLEYYTVYEFTDEVTGEKQLVKFNGHYHSYIGAEYVNYEFVEAKVKKVIIYE